MPPATLTPGRYGGHHRPSLLPMQPPMNAVASEKLSRIASSQPQEKIDVLLVEDSRSVRAMLGGYIRRLENVTLAEAATLAEAKALLDARSSPYFCAILDLTLPDASGGAVVDLVRSYGVPIIVLSGSVDESIRTAVRERRVIDYMVKDGAASLEDVAYLIGRLRQNREMRVLVVDDSASYRHHLCTLLKQYCFPVSVATDGTEALRVLAETPDVALVLTDVNMPGMDGLELVRRIRTRHHRENLAIIGLSDAMRMDIAIAMLKAGANDFLNKQFQPEEFYCRVVQNINMIGYMRELRDLANRDYLTRLYNRRYLFEIGERKFADARKAGHPLAVGVIDADHFKKVNDTYGHTMGDTVLKRIADTMRQTMARGDIVSRYGGEEFVCVMNVAGAPEAFSMFEQLRLAIQALELECEGIKVPVTVSIGFTCADAESLPKLIDLADQALYEAKTSGRNRVIEH